MLYYHGEGQKLKKLLKVIEKNPINVQNHAITQSREKVASPLALKRENLAVCDQKDVDGTDASHDVENLENIIL